MKALVALLSGTVFGFGLSLGAMTDPAKVAAFLDVAGRWDPTLAFVMGGALLVATPAFHFVFRRARPLLEKEFFLPKKNDVDFDLVAGAALFGVGWGISGLCPGPAIANLPTAIPEILGFVAAMAIGSLACDRWTAWRGKRIPQAAP